MSDPLTAAAILTVFFNASIETVAGKLTNAGIEKAKQLWQKVRDKLQGEPAVVAALTEVEQNHSQEHLAQVAPFLEVEMIKDPPFAQEIRQLAQEIHQELNLHQEGDTLNLTNINSTKSPLIKSHSIGHVGDQYTAESIDFGDKNY
jgi:hypothetical protein